MSFALSCKQRETMKKRSKKRGASSSKKTNNKGNEFVAKKVDFKKGFIRLYLENGQEIRTPISFYPLLEKATGKQRRNFELIGENTGIHWPDLDEHLSVEGIVLGRRAVGSN